MRNIKALAQSLSNTLASTGEQTQTIIPGPGGAFRPPVIGPELLSGMDWLKLGGLMVAGTVASCIVLCCICAAFKCLRGESISQQNDPSEPLMTCNA